MSKRSEKKKAKQLKKELKKMAKNKKKGMVDKVVMGAIIGGAIGSVVGITVAPKKGTETRQYLKDKGKEYYEKGKEAKEKFMDDHGDEINAVKQDAKDKGTKLWTYIKKLLFDRKEK